MAKKTIIDAITKLYSKLGGNLSDVLGTRSNVNFMGVGKSSEPFLDMDLNIEALGAISKSKALQELKSSVGFATADKLNDVQANKLLTNMMKMDEFYNPQQFVSQDAALKGGANITDLATGTRNLDAEGLASLRDRTGDNNVPLRTIEEIIANPRKMADEANFPGETFAANPTEQAGMIKSMRGIAKGDSDLMKRLDEIVKKKQTEAAAAKTTPFDEAVEYNARPEDVVQNLVDQKFGVGYFDNVGSTPAQRGSAREFLVEALKKENPNETNFADIIDAVDVKYITEGGGGLAGDPLTIVNKYFGPRIAEMVPSGASSEEIAIFTERVLNNVVDANGLRPGDPRFDRLTAKFTENFADGGIAGLETRQGYGLGSLVTESGVAQPASGLLMKLDRPVQPGDPIGSYYPDPSDGLRDLSKELPMSNSGGMGGMLSKLISNNPQLFANNILVDEDDEEESGDSNIAKGGLAKILEV